jgi:orotate phosphoribosyltransferase
MREGKLKERLQKILARGLVQGSFALSSGIEKNYMSIDRVWTDPGSFLEIAAILEEYLKNEDFDRIMAIDHIFNEFGALPIVAAVSSKMQKPLLIWKERGLLDHSFYGDISAGDKILILYDVTVGGRCLAKAAKDVEKIGGTITKIITLVDREEGAEKYLTELGYKFDMLMKLREITSHNKIGLNTE